MSLRLHTVCVTVVSALAVLAGCATQRPVLYPNAKFNQVGAEVAQKDIDACIQLAESHSITHDSGGNVARDGATGAVIGGAAGAGAGAVRGNIGHDAGVGAAAGAAAGVARGAIRSGQPGEVYKGFVQRCLREKGYDVIGWK